MDRRWVLRWILIAALPLQVSSCEELGPQTPAGPFAVAAHPSGGHLYVAGSTLTNSVWIVDAGLNQVAGAIPLDDPVGLAMSPSGMLYAIDEQNDTISAIDTATHTVVTHTHIGPEGSPVYVNGMGLNGTGTRVYIAGSNGLWLYDARTLQLLGSDPGRAATDVGSAPYLDEVYILNSFDHVMWMMRDLDELSEMTLPVEGSEIAVHPSGTAVYVADWSSQQILVIDPQRRVVVSTIPVPQQTMALAVHPAASVLYVTGVDAVYAITLPPGSIRNFRHVGRHLWGIAVHPSGTHLYVSDDGEHVVHVLDASTLGTTAVIRPP